MLPPLIDLLSMAGFTVRGHSRATCAYCRGGDRLTVSFNEDVAHCFRCQWKSNRMTLAKELGILEKSLSPAERETLAREQKESIRKQKLRAEFNRWKNTHLNKIVYQYQQLHTKARLARKVLALYPDNELAWCALADFYHKESYLSAAFDTFACALVSQWLEQDSQLSEVVQLWRHEQTR